MVVSELIESAIDFPGEIADVAAQGPIEGGLVITGALLVILPSVALGLLTLGAVVDMLTPESFGATHP